MFIFVIVVDINFSSSVFRAVVVIIASYFFNVCIIGVLFVYIVLIIVSLVLKFGFWLIKYICSFFLCYIFLFFSLIFWFFKICSKVDFLFSFGLMIVIFCFLFSLMLMFKNWYCLLLYVCWRFCVESMFLWLCVLYVCCWLFL